MRSKAAWAGVRSQEGRVHLTFCSSSRRSRSSSFFHSASRWDSRRFRSSRSASSAWKEASIGSTSPSPARAFQPHKQATAGNDWVRPRTKAVGDSQASSMQRAQEEGLTQGTRKAGPFPISQSCTPTLLLASRWAFRACFSSSFRSFLAPIFPDR